MGLCEHWHSLYHKVVWNDDFLTKALEETAKFDEFTGKLWEMYLRYGKDNMQRDQPIQIAVVRSDYMLHFDGEKEVFKQVEMNTISSAFAHLSSKVTQLHQFLLPELLCRNMISSEAKIPDNLPCKVIAKVMATAHHLKLAECDLSPELYRSVILMIVQDGERNSIDQRGLEYMLWQNHQIRVVRRSLLQISDSARLESGELILEDKFLVSICYFRAGYTPKDYPTEKHWTARELMEKSKAVKCPSVAWHLSGAKRVQQELSSIEVLKQLVGDEVSGKLMECTARQWNFHDLSSIESVIKLAIEDPQDFVLKPQREGGE